MFLIAMEVLFVVLLESDLLGNIGVSKLDRHFSIVFSTHKKLKFENFIENIAVTVSGCEEYPADGMKESYTLNVKSNPDSGPSIHIYAEAEWGVIHALESVTQVSKSLFSNPLSLNQSFLR